MQRTAILTLLATGALVLAAVVWLGGGPPSPIRVGPDALDFGSITLGARERNVLIATNVSEAPVSIDRISIDAPYKTSRSKLELDPGQSREIMVSFVPTESGEFAATVRLDIDASGRSIEVPVQGAARSPASIAVTPQTIDFGKVAVGTTAHARIRVENHGETELEVLGLPGGKPFSPDENALKVAPNGVEHVVYSFSPEATRSYAKSLMIRSNDPERGRTLLRVSGEGTDQPPNAKIEVTPGSLDFGDASDCQSGKKWISIANPGSDPLAIASIEVPAPFVSATRGRSVPPGQQMRLPVFYAPKESGRHDGTLTIFSNAPGAGPIEIALEGSGSVCVASAEAVSGPLDLGTGGPRSIFSPIAGGGGTGGRAGVAGVDDPALLPPGDAVADEDDVDLLAPGQAVLVEGDESYIRIGSYRSDFTDFHVGGIDYDPGSGRFVMRDLRPPVIDAALGEYFQFDTIDRVEGRIDAFGETELVFELTMYDPWGNKTTIPVRLSTNPDPIFLDGQQVMADGHPLDANDEILTGVVVPVNEGSFEGSVMRMTMRFKIK